MQWLSPIDFAAQQYDIISRKEEGTGQWFLDSAQFHAWQQGPDRTLFCPGIPGAGKTMVAAIAIDHLCKRARSEDLGVAYLFCNYKAQAEQTYAVLLATVLKQLMYGRPDIAGPVTRMHESHEKQNNRPSPDEIFRALQSACSAYSTVYLVVDALDECTDRDRARTKLIDRLRELQAKISVRVMFTSRFIPEIREKFQSDPMLEVRASEHDVRRYVAGQLPRLPKCIQRSSELIQSVQDKIAEAVDGMFLLARLHVDSLLDKKTTQKVKTTLQALKGGAESLEIAYNEAIERIEGQLNGDKLLAKQALSWITYAQRPLSTQELCHALAIEIGDSELDPDAVYDIDDILSVCAGLVIVDSESNAVRLVHYTTQEYFKRTRLEWLPNAQQDIALACVTYLSMDAFLNGSCNSDEAFEARLRDHMFLNYAARHWASHANTTQEAISGPALAFLRNERLVLATTQAALIGTYGPNGYSLSGYSQMFPRQTNGLHLAARQGCTYLAGMLLKELECSIDADSKDGNDQTPLLLAAQHGHEAVVRLLVERDDVEADAKDRFGQTPLSWAAGAGEEAVVRLLSSGTTSKSTRRTLKIGRRCHGWQRAGMRQSCGCLNWLLLQHLFRYRQSSLYLYLLSSGNFFFITSMAAAIC
ncbi:hypothetical protein AOQ84DRAFT_199979 [Glonium stellatum]|uniref:Uncharacterized protein n=1 Tax=Glonium stellatum TaxID=574774 RepID=A0A8E2ENW1_9PEZI|nr:hypothetical protein AOQ84DRAFT_199979 [Glonium stellatum]